jgi:hypothetical protein
MSSKASIVGAFAVLFAGCLMTIDRGRLDEQSGGDGGGPDGDAAGELDAGDSGNGEPAPFQLVWPVGGWVAAGEQHPDDGEHSGSADIAVPYWTPVGAARSGTVVTSSLDDENGFFVTLDHGHGYRTLYGHLSAASLLESGQAVTTGQQIGYSGRTGITRDNGAHLHFAIFKDGSRVPVPSPEPGSWVTRGAPIEGSYAPLPLLAERGDVAFDVKVVASSAPLFDAPAATASPIGSVTTGDLLRVVDSREGYYRVEGGAAWVVHSATMPTGSELSLVVVTTSANVRSGPSTADSIIGAAPSGSLVTIFGRSGLWGRLLTGQPAVYGWMHLESTAPTTRFRTHVRSKTLSVYGGPGFAQPISETRVLRDPLLVEEAREGWYRIDHDGQPGWLPGWLTEGPL